MTRTATSQSELARISGVRQPTISQVLSGKVGISDEQLDRLLSCMGYRLEVTRRPVTPELTRSELRTWRLHRRLATRLDDRSLDEWLPTIERNLERLRSRVRGEPHVGNIAAWASLAAERDLTGLHRVMTGLDRHSIEMREVSPLRGLLSERERLEVLKEAS
jgi:transcriptional regulator with XRE-family HTH domain